MNTIPSAAELLETAQLRTGLRRTGDPQFLVALDELVRSINTEATVTPDGAVAATERWLRVIVNRLRLEEAFIRTPSILEETLLPPLVICGLPRVGSTKLHRLLAESGDFQALLFWQGYNPAPFPDADPVAPDPRIAAAVEFLQWRSSLNPAADAAHHMAALEPEEDTYLLEYTLHTYWPTSYFNVPTFLRWLSRQDRDAAFLFVRKLLQYLQRQFHAGNARPWLLKSPPNLGFERELARHLPGARFVVLHRDPIEVVPSTVAIVREVRRLYCGAPGNLKLVGDWAMEEYPAAMARHMAWRRTASPGSVIDIAYRDVVEDEAGVIDRVYRHCGLPLSEAAKLRMQRCSAENAQHKFGEHRYSLGESGLTPERVRRGFAPYIEEFSEYLQGTAGQSSR